MLDCTNNFISINVCENQTTVLILSCAVVICFKRTKEKVGLCTVLLYVEVASKRPIARSKLKTSSNDYQ